MGSGGTFRRVRFVGTADESQVASRGRNVVLREDNCGSAMTGTAIEVVLHTTQRRERQQQARVKSVHASVKTVVQSMEDGGKR